MLKKILRKWRSRLGLLMLAAVMAGPAVMVLIGSLMRREELRLSFGAVLPDGTGYAFLPLLPYYPTLANYRQLLLQTMEFYVMFWNSVLQTAGILLGQLAVGIPAAWAFAKWRARWKNGLFRVYVVLMMAPFQVLMVPEYLTLYRFRLIDTPYAVVLPAVFATLPVFILTRFFRAVPDELLEAARLDGASELSILAQTGIPLGKGGIGAVVILSFLEYWNGVEAPLAFLQNRVYWPVSLYLPSISEQEEGVALAASFLILIPAFLLFLAGRDWMEEGIANTGLKG